MCRFLVTALASVAAFTSATGLDAGEDSKSSEGTVRLKGTGGILAVIDGEVFMAPLPKRMGYSWGVKRTEKGVLVYQKFSADSTTGHMVVYRTPFYLSCEPPSKGSRVFLAKEPGEGSYWGLPRVPSRKDPDYDDGGASRPGPIRCKF